ncbi:hypothetical protein Tco_0023295, partial [Tanacetum coccineum]
MAAGGNLMTRNTQDALTIIENKARDQEPETITEVVEITSFTSTPLAPPPNTPPIIDIIDSLCDKFPIENNSLSDNPTSSSDSVVKSLSPFPTPFGDNKSSGSTNTQSDYSLPDYEAFYFDDNHFEEKSSGSTTTHFDSSLPKYDSFIFDLSTDLFPPTDRSDF